MANNEQKFGMEENVNEEIVGVENENVILQREGDLSTSSMNENASSAAKIENSGPKAKKRSIKFHGWLPDLLDWIKRTELAQSSLSTSSYTFNRYCWPNLHGKKPYIVWKLQFLRAEDIEGNGQAILQKDPNYFFPKLFRLIPNEDVQMLDPIHLPVMEPSKLLIPIANINPPEYIKGFGEIKFEFIDDRALEFMQKIVPILKEVTIRFEFIFDGFEDNPRIGPLSQLMALLAPKANRLQICGNCTYGNSNKFNDLNTFNEHFPDYIYGFQSICILFCTESVVDLLVKWLNAKRDDGMMKMLFVNFNYPSQAMKLIDHVKEEFSKSIEAANFIISICAEMDEVEEEEDDEDQGFKIKNKATGEILELDCKNPSKHLLIRHKNESALTEIDWHEQFKQEMNTPKMNTTTIIMP